MPAPSSAKSLKLILNLINDGEYYSGHLKARSTVARLVGKSTAYDDKAKEAAEILFQSAQLLLEKGQLGSGSDLALYLVEVWSQKGVPCTDTERAQLQQLIALAGRQETWRASIISAASTWTAKTGSNPAGDPLFHTYIGELLFKEKDYAAAEPHLLAAQTRDAARVLAQLLYDWSLLDGHKTDGAGRYIARGVLSYLEASSILAAHACLSHFLSLLTTAQPTLLLEKVPLPSGLSTATHSDLLLTRLPSLNFLQLAIHICQAGPGTPLTPSPRASQGAGRAAWNSLWNKYEREATWLRSEPVQEAKTTLGEIYFGIRSSRAENPLASLMGSLFGGAPPAPSANASRQVAPPPIDLD